MPTYEFSLPDGQSFEIDSPSELNHDQLSYVASNHKQFLAAKQPKPEVDLNQQDIQQKTEAYSKPGGFNQFLKDTDTPMSLVGLAEQIPLGIQAVAQTGARALGGLAGLPSGKSKEYGDQAAQWVAEHTGAFTPQTNAGRAMAASVGSLINNYTDYVQNPENVKNLISNVPFVGPDLAEDVPTQAAVSGLATALPELAMVKPIAGGIAKPLEIIKQKYAASKEVPVNKLDALDKIAPEAPNLSTSSADNFAPKMTPEQIQEHYAQGEAQRRATQQQYEQEQTAYKQSEEVKKQGYIQQEAEQLVAQQELHARNDAYAKQQEAFKQQQLDKQTQLENQRNQDMQDLQQRNEAYKQSVDEENKVRQEQQARQAQSQQEQIDLLRENKAKNDELMRQQEQARNEANGINRDVQVTNDLANKLRMEKEANEYNKAQEALKFDKAATDAATEAARAQVAAHLAEVNKSAPSTAYTGQRVSKAPTADRFVPKSQRGGINFDEVTKALGGAVKRIGEAFNRIPGHEDTGRSFLADYPNPVDTLAKIKASVAVMGDKIAKAEAWRSGSSMKYIETQHPVIKAAADYMQTAAQRADRQILNVVKPVEHLLQKFNWNDKQGLVELSQLFKKEMFERRTFTSEQLAQAGYTPKQIEAYNTLRGAYDKAYHAQNEVLKSKGLPELSKSEYYMSSRWAGDWRSNVYDTEGHLVWVIKDHTEKGVKQALAHLESQGIPIDRNKSTVEYTRNSHAVSSDMPAAYASMMQHIGETNPLAQKVREVMDAKMMGQAHEALAQSKHFKNKANVRGFVGDRPWMNPFDDAKDLFHEQIQYLKNSFQWSEYNKAADQVKGIIHDPEIVKNSPGAVKQAHNIIDHYLGAGQHQLFTKLEESLARGAGRSVSDIRNYINFGKTGWILQKMGTNTGALVQNIIQPVNTIPFHTLLSEQGLSHNPIKTLLASTLDTIAGLQAHYGNKIGMPDLKFSTKLGKDALKYAESNGILDLSSFDEHTNINSSRAQVAVQRTLGMPVITADKISKFSAFLSFAHHLEQSGKFANRMELLREAEHYMNASMVDPRSAERPFVIQDSGIVGNAASTLQSYTMNYLNQLHMFSERAYRDKKPAALLQFLAISGALSGLGGITALNYGVAGYDAIRNLIAKSKPEWYDKLPDLERQLLVDVGEGMGKAGEALKYGIPSMITGSDLSKKFETTVSAPIAGPIADIGKQISSVIGGLVQGDKKGLTQAAYSVAPTGVAQGALDVYSGSFQDPKSGKYAPPSSGDFSRGYFRTDKDKLMKTLGVTSISESRQKEIIYQRAKADANDKLVNQGLAQKTVESLMQGNGDKGKNDYFNNLVKRDPDQASTLVQASMQKYIVDHNLDARSIDIMKAKTLNMLQNYQRYYGAQNATQR